MKYIGFSKLTEMLVPGVEISAEELTAEGVRKKMNADDPPTPCCFERDRDLIGRLESDCGIRLEIGKTKPMFYLQKGDTYIRVEVNGPTFLFFEYCIN